MQMVLESELPLRLVLVVQEGDPLARGHGQEVSWHGRVPVPVSHLPDRRLSVRPDRSDAEAGRGGLQQRHDHEGLDVEGWPARQREWKSVHASWS